MTVVGQDALHYSFEVKKVYAQFHDDYDRSLSLYDTLLPKLGASVRTFITK